MVHGRMITGSALTVALLTLPAIASMANLIADGDFESPTTTSGTFQTFNVGQNIGTNAWTVIGTGSVALVNTTYSEPGNGMIAFNAQSGLNSLDLTGPGNTISAGVSQSVATTVGHTYDLSFYVGTADTNNGSSAYASPAIDLLSINGGPTTAYSNPNLTTSPGFINWEQFSTSFVATGASTSIAFINGSAVTTNEGGLDNVVLTDAGVVGATSTPEPGVLALLGSSFSGVSLLALRRRNAHP